MKKCKFIQFTCIVISILIFTSCEGNSLHSQIPGESVNVVNSSLSAAAGTAVPFLTPTPTPFPTPTVPDNPSWESMITAKYSEYENYGKEVPDGQVGYYSFYDPDNLFKDKTNDRIIGYKDGKKVYELKLQNSSKNALYPVFKDPAPPAQDIYKHDPVFNVGFLNGSFKKISDEKYRNHLSYTRDSNGDILTVSAGSYLFDSVGNILLDKTVYMLSGNRYGYAVMSQGLQYDLTYGLLNLKTGKIQIPCVYTNLVFLSKDTLFVETFNGEQKIIDINGNELFNVSGEYGVFAQDSDYIPLRKNNKEGYVDRKGNWKIEAQYEAAYPFINEVAPVIFEKNKIIFISKSNKKLKTINTSYLEQFTVNKKAVYKFYNDEKNIYEVMDNEFKVLFGSEEIYVYEDYGKALFDKDGKVGIYDFIAKKITDTNISYDKYAYYLQDGFIVSINFEGEDNDSRRYYDVYNLSGKVLFTKSQITYMSPDDKFMWVCDDLYRGYIDSQGNWVYKEKRYINIYD